MKRKSHKRKQKKRAPKLGQHFLRNRGIAFAVAEAARVEKGDTVLEIGPGTGMLTHELLSRGARVVAIEKDGLMMTHLQNAFPQEIAGSQLLLREGDIRELTPDTLCPKGNYKIVANIPYYITGEIIRGALTAKNPPFSIALLVQKEVAERIARSKKESILSISVKAYGTPRYVKSVGRGSFNPPPEVDSAILAIENISRKNFQNLDEKLFFEVVKAGFAQKRKTLSGNLKKVFGQEAVVLLRDAGISENMRAEDIPLAIWLTLSKKTNSLLRQSRYASEILRRHAKTGPDIPAKT